MKRRSFFARFAGVSVAAPVAVKALATAEAPKPAPGFVPAAPLFPLRMFTSNRAALQGGLLRGHLYINAFDHCLRVVHEEWEPEIVAGGSCGPVYRA